MWPGLRQRKQALLAINSTRSASVRGFNCYDHGPEDLFFFYCRDSLTYRGLLHLPSLANATQTPSKVYRLRFHCIYLYPVSGLSFHTVDILNAPFRPYCMYHNTLDPLPIRLVVDRPLWTSSVYIRRPLLR